MVVTSNTRENHKMLRAKRANQIFEDLDRYRDFCRDHGYRFDERDLYRRNTAYGQYERLLRGDPVVNHWVEDAKYYARPIGG